MNIFEDYEVKAAGYQKQIMTLTEQLQQKDMKITQLIEELTTTKIELGKLKKEK